LVVAIVDAITLIISASTGEIAMIVHEKEFVEKLANLVIIGVVACISISVLISAYLGIKGIKEATKPSGGKLHIILAKIILIINCLMALVVVVALFKSDSMWNDICTLCSCLVDASIMFFYASECKKVSQSLKK
jgi:hypothetical protein